MAKNNGLQATANILSALNGTNADIRPDKNDYEITAQLSQNGDIAWIKVLYYDDEIHHKLLTFVADFGQNTLETNAGNKIKIQFEAEGYAMTLEQIHHGTQNVTTRTYSAAKILDNSYNSYIFTIYTNQEAWSPNMEKAQLKQAKREAKGKKQQSAADLM